MEAATARLGRGRKKRGKTYGSEERRLAALLLTPAMAVIALVAAYPIGYAIWLSLTEYSVRVPGKWRFAGFDNYTEAFGSSEFWTAVKNTFIFTGVSVTLELAIGLGMAIAMHEAFKGRGLLRTVVLVPWAVLTVVSAITWRTLFEPNLGLAPQVLDVFGIGGNIVWLGQEGYAMA
ncbi:MAG TPA: sugar ABC transporter permease, partial [Beijerinckiaceae bacterium]|nr:sugar ABC transporter permease [Beijerinckiaceae bacterium]